MDLVAAFINRFPIEVIHVYTITIYVKLVQQLGNETEYQCKQKLIHVIKFLLEKTDESQFNQLLKMCEEWINNKTENSVLTMAGLQALSAFVLQREHELTNYNYQSMMDLIIKQIQPAINIHTSVIRVSDYGASNIWKNAYLGISDIERILRNVYKTQQGLLNKVHGFRNGFKVCLDLFLFPHRWIRLACARVLGWYMSVVGIEYLAIRSKKSIEKKLKNKKGRDRTKC